MISSRSLVLASNAPKQGKSFHNHPVNMYAQYTKENIEELKQMTKGNMFE